MKTEKAIFACGCFWGVQHQMERAAGVIRTTVGYTGGHKENPTYPEVKAHTTGHAEAVLVEYDATQTTYTDLCKLFLRFTIRHRPTDKARILARNTAVRFLSERRTEATG